MIINPVGEIDMFSLPEFEAAIATQLKQGRRVLIDLRDVTFFAARGLRALEDATALAVKLGSELYVLAPQRHPAAQLIRLFGLTSTLPMLHMDAGDLLAGV